MNAVRHADLARQLISACGGFVAAAAKCRLSKSFLQKCCDASTGRALPIDVVWVLQKACKSRIYTDALHEAWDETPDLDDLVTEAAEAIEAAAEAQRVIRIAAGKRRPNAAGKQAIKRVVAKLVSEVRDLRLKADEVAA